MSDVRRTYEDVLKDHGWLYYHGFSLPMTPEQLDMKLLISHLRAVEAQLTATQEKLAAAESTPVRDDARDERLINFAINAEVSYQRRVAIHRTAKEILAAFNTQDKP